ncbi:MAG: hypothetical protein E7467_01680 [Ruminococcaceae bacterium]|nr:hypothetical protein [Oscillospiraceae bacterium]
MVQKGGFFMDDYRVQAVWQRVRQGTELEQILARAIEEEYRSHVTYLAMAKCGRYPQLSAMAMQEAQHARELETLYDLLFECRPCRPRFGLPKIQNFCQALREAYRGECEAKQNYLLMAKNHPAHEELFSRLARQEAAHASCLHRMHHAAFRQ